MVAKKINFQVVMYIIIFIFAFYALNKELSVWKCNPIYSKITDCQGTGDIDYRNSKPSQEDNCSELLKKVKTSSSVFIDSNKWRRSFVLSFVIVLLLFVLVITPSKLPDWNLFYASVIIGFTVIYLSFSYYEAHIYNIPQEYVNESIRMIEEKMRENGYNC